MTLPSSGPLTLADIQTEFGGSNPISLSEYYAGGAYVPAGATGTYGAVPSSGAISIRNFYGTTKGPVVTNGTSTFVIKSTTIYYYGYDQAVGGAAFNFGSITAGTFSGATIKAAFSTSPGNSAGNAMSYMVIFDGNRTAGFFNTLTVNGTLVSGSLSAPTYDSGNNETRFTITLGASAPTLFGTTAGVSIPILLT